MKRQTIDIATAKVNPHPDPRTLQAAPWTKNDKQTDPPASPPAWTRYIDSRLKQFCVR